MTRTNAVVIAVATELAATRADAARLPFEILAPRNQDAADGQGCTTTESRRNHPTLYQQNKGGNYEGHAQDN